jgi:hypothetical protein
MGWHADDETLYGKNSTICSISLGHTRDFHLREKANHLNKRSYSLGNGDLFVMAGAVQQFFEVHTTVQLVYAFSAAEAEVSNGFRSPPFPFPFPVGTFTHKMITRAFHRPYHVPFRFNCSVVSRAGTLQTLWQHRVPKRANVAEARISLTFRTVRFPSGGQ